MNDIQNFLSIGSACRTRFQIDRYCKTVYPDYKPIFYFFDRLMAGGISGVINLIERDLILREDDLEIVELNGRYIPRDKFSKMAFLHDFGAHGDWWDDYQDCCHALSKGMAASLELYSELGRKTKSLLKSDKEVVLIYHGVASTKSFDALHRLLSINYKKKFLILNILEEGSQATAQNASVVTRYVRDSQSPKIGKANEWEGWDDSWAEAISSALVNTRKFSLIRDYIPKFIKYPR